MVATYLATAKSCPGPHPHLILPKGHLNQQQNQLTMFFSLLDLEICQCHIKSAFHFFNYTFAKLVINILEVCPPRFPTGQGSGVCMSFAARVGSWPLFHPLPAT